jgi:hypothetical protein
MTLQSSTLIRTDASMKDIAYYREIPPDLAPTLDKLVAEQRRQSV